MEKRKRRKREREERKNKARTSWSAGEAMQHTDNINDIYYDNYGCVKSINEFPLFSYIRLPPWRTCTGVGHVFGYIFGFIYFWPGASMGWWILVICSVTQM